MMKIEHRSIGRKPHTAQKHECELTWDKCVHRNFHLFNFIDGILVQLSRESILLDAQVAKKKKKTDSVTTGDVCNTRCRKYKYAENMPRALMATFLMSLAAERAKTDHNLLAENSAKRKYSLPIFWDVERICACLCHFPLGRFSCSKKVIMTEMERSWCRFQSTSDHADNFLHTIQSIILPVILRFIADQIFLSPNALHPDT